MIIQIFDHYKLYNLSYLRMAPKPAPKLTKKQLQQLKKQQQRKKEAQEKLRKQQQQARLQQKMKLDAIERTKRAEQQRVRIVLEKEAFRETLLKRIKEENRAADAVEDQKKWRQLTTQYHKSYDTSGPKLSTFINVFQQQKHQNPQKILKSCEQAEIYTRYVGHSMLHARGFDKKDEQKYYSEAIIRIRKIQMQKIEEIMIQMANNAEEMQDKNSELSKKGQPNKKVQGLKILQYQQHMNKYSKIGMFLNSNTTKNLNKFRPIQIKEFGLNTYIPSKWMNANTIVKFQWVNFNPYCPGVHQKFIHIGGVYILQFFQLLLGSKKINNIVLKKYYKGTEILQKFKLTPNIIKQPFDVMYQIPKYVFLHTFNQNSLRFAQFDLTANKWLPLPSDTVIEFDDKQKKAICRLYKPEPIAYIQQRCTDYPYIAWELRSVEPGKAHLDIELKRHLLPKQGQQNQRLILTFVIDSDSIKLLTDQSYPQLQDLKQPKWTPSSILYQLSQRGIHLLPINDDYEQARIPVKDTEAEQNAIRDIAYAIQSYYIRSEVNNSNDIIVKIRQNLQYEKVFLEDQQKDWKKIRWLSDNRCQVTNRNVPLRHVNLETLLQNHNFSLPECLDKIKYQKNYLFKRNIIELLSLTRILAFTTSTAQQSNLRWVLKEKQLIKL